MKRKKPVLRMLEYLGILACFLSILFSAQAAVFFKQPS